jgi:hypothetical protein
MSDGREERKEQEERRRWQEPKDLDDELDRDWPIDEERERRDSLAAGGGAASRIGRPGPAVNRSITHSSPSGPSSVSGFAASASYNRLFT